MPCDDITETIRIRFGADDRLAGYSLNKRTCGGGVGTAGLLEGFLRGRTADEILALGPEDVPVGEAGAGNPGKEAAGQEEFLALKHFFAVRIALEVLTGRAPGGVGDRCVVAGVTCDAEGLAFEADIPVDLPTERIRACGRRGQCPSARETK